jgi:DNA repair protein RadA/Sms
MVEEIVRKEKVSSPLHSTGYQSQVHRLDEIKGDLETRLPVSMQEMSRVLGGGIVPGSLVLIGGDPGIGKSTLVLQMSLDFGEKRRVLYVSGEESETQIKMRARRLVVSSGENAASYPDNIYLVTETSLPAIMEHIDEINPQLLVVDSIQTTYLPDLESLAGSVSQVRESASRLREKAKQSGMSVILIGHVTKEGTIAGPRVLEHIVDTVLYLEGDRYQAYRLLRSVKNRFGATSEVGVFEMREKGLIEVTNPSAAFLSERLVNVPGSAVTVTMEGTRPILVEIQGLTSPSAFGNPRRTPNGVDFNRLLLTTAVLSRRASVKLTDQDVFVNVIGGLNINEPAIDLAVAGAIASSARNIPLRADTVIVGEVGLSGEIRSVSQLSARLREAVRLGYRRAVVPKRLSTGEPFPQGLRVIETRSLKQALQASLMENEKT